jgi:ATP-dependent DNA helicase RecG
MMRKAPPDELLPESVRDKHGMPSLVEALAFLHQPPPEVDLATVAAGKHPCQLRLSFEELLAHYMSLRNLRNLAKKENAFALARGGAAVERFVSRLPFELTGAQRRVIDEISADLELPHPMMRFRGGGMPARDVLRRAGCGYGANRVAGRTALAELQRLV